MINAATEEREEERIRMERESFVVLQHMYTLSGGDDGAAVALPRVSGELGFEAPRFTRLIDHLAAVGHVSPIAGGTFAAITAAGVDYIERLAWRRRSVRLAREESTNPPLGADQRR